MSHNITVEGGDSVRLPTAGKYCDRDIVVTAQRSYPILQEKTVSPAMSFQSVTPDSGYDGLSKVTVNPMPTVTQATPSISVSGSGVITASATQSSGYVVYGTKRATRQLAVQEATTITPSTSSQTAVPSGYYTTGAVTVAAIPSSYVQPSGGRIITSNGTYDVYDYSYVAVEVESPLPETCTVTIRGTSSLKLQAVYADGGTSYKSSLTTAAITSQTIEVLKNSIIYVSFVGTTGTLSVSGSISRAAGGTVAAYFVSGTGTISASSSSGGSVPM